jgi:hypothetical protein
MNSSDAIHVEGRAACAVTSNPEIDDRLGDRPIGVGHGPHLEQYLCSRLELLMKCS